MNRFLRISLLGVALLLALHAALYANYLQAIVGSAMYSKVIWAETIVAVLLAWAGLQTSLKAKFKVFSMLMVFVIVELFLQVTAWLGVLPLVTTKINAPYSRVYWNGEGLGNSIRNRYGWYCPAFDLKSPHRVVVVGDSQVEAVEVAPARNQAAVLHKLLQAWSPNWSVLGLGSHGTSQAFSIEVLDYAGRHFQPSEAIVAVTLGSDIIEASPALNPVPPSAFIYYDLDEDGKLVLHPDCAGARKRFNDTMEMNAKSLLLNLPMILYSHCMTIHFANSLRHQFALRQRKAELTSRAAAISGKEAEQFALMGFNPLPFAMNLNPECSRAMEILLAQLRECQAVCDRHRIKLRLVTIPSFPKVFYDSQQGREWTMQIGDYDYFKPERELADWASTNGIAILPMGEYIQNQTLSVDEIRSLYFSNGMGHLSEKGHRFFAQAMFKTFYQTITP